MNFAIFDEDDDEEGGDQDGETMPKQEDMNIEGNEESKIVDRRLRTKEESKRKRVKDDVSDSDYYIDDPEEEKVNTKRTIKKQVKGDDTEDVRNLIDFSKSSEEDKEVKEKRK